MRAVNQNSELELLVLISSLFKARFKIINRGNDPLKCTLSIRGKVKLNLKSKHI